MNKGDLFESMDQLNSTARLYKHLQTQIKRLEEELHCHKNALSLAALEHGRRLDLPDFKVYLIELSREHFVLEKAREVIPELTLKPHIKTIYYSQLRIATK